VLPDFRHRHFFRYIPSLPCFADFLNFSRSEALTGVSQRRTMSPAEKLDLVLYMRKYLVLKECQVCTVCGHRTKQNWVFWVLNQMMCLPCRHRNFVSDRVLFARFDVRFRVCLGRALLKLFARAFGVPCACPLTMPY